MKRTRDLGSIALFSCGIFLLAGCQITPLTPLPATSVGTPAGTSVGTSGGTSVGTSGGTSAGTSGGTSVGASGGASSGNSGVASSGGTGPASPSLQSSIYLVASGVAEASDSPDSVFIFPLTTTGFFDDEVPSWQLAGSQVSVDGAGNIYLLTDHEIAVIAPTSPYLLDRSRSLPVGPGTKLPVIKDMVASLTGEIFVSDGKGLAVFSATATGNADPARYIMGSSQAAGSASTTITPGLIATDASDNLYAVNTADSSIVVFGPTDTGKVVPSRTILSPLAGLIQNASRITGITTDAAGNLYVLCRCSLAGSEGTDFGVLEFSPTANGNVAPIRFVTTPGVDPNYSGGGIAVDAAGTIYVGGGSGTGTQIFEFSAGSSGSVAPSNIVTSRYGGTLSGIALH